MIELYQFPISHYCEKVRWALAYKGLDHQLHNLLPGFHGKKMIKRVGTHSVPVIVDQGRALADSSKIISYLDQHYPEKLLTPVNPTFKQEALEWERFADKEIGIHVRRICYHSLLEQPALVKNIFAQGGPWYAKILLHLVFPKLRKKMRILMKIDEVSVEDSKKRLVEALHRVEQRLEQQKFLAGEQFSRADLTVAALLAPFVRPAKYGLAWPETYPAQLQAFIDTQQKPLQWVQQIYQAYR